MADFCITAVRYNKDRRHIDYVHVREEKPETIGPERIVSRAFVADLIRLNRATFQTWTKTPENKWKLGAKVHLIDGEYLTTNKNSTARTIWAICRSSNTHRRRHPSRSNSQGKSPARPRLDGLSSNYSTTLLPSKGHGPAREATEAICIRFACP